MWFQVLFVLLLVSGSAGAGLGEWKISHHSSTNLVVSNATIRFEVPAGETLWPEFGDSTVYSAGMAVEIGEGSCHIATADTEGGPVLWVSDNYDPVAVFVAGFVSGVTVVLLGMGYRMVRRVGGAVGGD